jgi:hypothetical protein
VGRAALFVLSVLALAGSAWTFARNGGHLHRGGQVELVTGREAQDVELEAAAAQMLQGKLAAGSFEGLQLRGFHNLTIVSADDARYCLQLGSGGSSRHLAGPGGVPAAGPCLAG